MSKSITKDHIFNPKIDIWFYNYNIFRNIQYPIKKVQPSPLSKTIPPHSIPHNNCQLILIVVRRSIMSNILIELIWSLERCDNHLREYRFLFLEISELLLKIIILLFLIDHAELERTVERLHERCRSRGNFLIYVIDLSPHGVELLPEQLDQIVVLLQVLIRLASQALNQGYIVHRQYPNVQLRGWSLWPIFQGNRTCSSIKLYNFLYYKSLFICTEESL